MRVLPKPQNDPDDTSGAQDDSTNTEEAEAESEPTAVPAAAAAGAMLNMLDFNSLQL